MDGPEETRRQTEAAGRSSSCEEPERRRSIPREHPLDPLKEARHLLDILDFVCFQNSFALGCP